MIYNIEHGPQSYPGTTDDKQCYSEVKQHQPLIRNQTHASAVLSTKQELMY